MSRTIDDLFDQYGPSYRWLATAVVILGTLTTALSTTIVNVAIPDIMGAFGVGQDMGQWMSTAFLAANTATMLANAWCVQSFGPRSTYVGAMLLFIGASVLGGLGNDINVLILARALQGGAAGLIQPLAMLIMFRVFPPDQRGNAMGYFGIGVIMAPAFGPTLGGILVDEFNWRAVFFIAPLVGSLAIVPALAFLPDREEEGPIQRFDWIGFVLLSVFLLTVLTGFSNGQKLGWHSDTILGYFAIAGTSACAFLAWELYNPRPLLQLRVYAYPGFAAAAGVAFIFGAGLFGSTYLIPLFVQLQLGYTPTLSGVLLMPAGLVMGALFLPAGRLSDRFSPHWAIMLGFTIFALATLALFDIDVDTNFWTLAMLILLGRVGLTLIMPSVSVGAMNALPNSLMNQGSGAINFTRQLGGAFGVNLLAVYLGQRTAFHADKLAATQVPDNATTQQILATMHQLFARAGLGEVAQAASARQFLSQVIAAKASLFSFRDAFIVVGLVFLLGLVPAAVLGYVVSGRRNRKELRPAPPSQPGEGGPASVPTSAT